MATLGKINYEKIAELRSILTELPPKAKHTQNQIFTNLMREDGSEFLLSTLKPNIVGLKESNDVMTNLERILFLRKEQIRWYDFIGKLTEQNEDGSPTVSDETFQNFFEWYQSNLAKRQHELNAECQDNITKYSGNVKKVVDKGYLPESFMENLEFLNPDSPESCDLNFSLFDMMGHGSSATGSYASGFRIDKKAPISIRADAAVGLNKYIIIWHELTHAISGDIFNFGDDEANRIVNEALTEHISHVICNVEEGIGKAENFDFMSGRTYNNERGVVKWLASGGVKTISPQMFYEAYAEYDHNYEKKHDEWLYGGKKEYPKPEIGPKKEALYSALLEAFPDCKDPNDLGKMITEKFIEISQNSAH